MVLDSRAGDLSIAAAADLAGVSRDTIKRRLGNGAFPGAFRGRGSGPGGPWCIPVADLELAGLVGDVRDVRDVRDGAEVPSPDLRTQLAVAQAEATLLRAHIADLRRLLHARRTCSCGAVTLQ